jgi:hypothetical protein
MRIAEYESGDFGLLRSAIPDRRERPRTFETIVCAELKPARLPGQMSIFPPGSRL